MIQTMAIFADAGDTVALGDGGSVWTIPMNMTIVGVCSRAGTDDTGATVDIQVATADVITALDCHLAGTPGRWQSVHTGGTNAAIEVAADSVMEIDYNSHAVGVSNLTVIYYLAGVAN